MDKKIFLVLFLVFPIIGFSQYYLIGQDPASVKWKQIKTDNFQVVFPQEYGNIAQYYANVLEMSSMYVGKPYIKKLKRVTIVLHNRTIVSNAMVSPAPFHADFFEMPSQEIYPQIWQDQLALHEYRHVVQMTKLRQGFTKGMYYVFGEQGIAAIFGTFLPFWFIEGDAVFSETVHSNSGRGRIPEFSYKLKAQILDKKIYKYDKAQFGSYNDFTPDHYTLGYHLVIYGIEKFGIGMWNNMLNNVAKKPFTLIPFTHSLKKSTGSGKVGYYKKAINSLYIEWQKEDSNLHDSIIVSLKNKFYSNYLFPQSLSDGSIICEKTGKDDIHRFVRVYNNGKEKQLFTPGFDFNESLSANDSLICWNEKSFDMRWNNRNFSVIKIYNFKTGKLKTITHKSRLFAPAISHNAQKIVTVNVSKTGKYELMILNANNGTVLKTIKTADNLFFITPHWSNNDTTIVVIVLGKKGKQIRLVNENTGNTTPVLPFTFADIKWPVMYDDFVVFTGTFNGSDDLYALRLSNKKLYKITNARFGSAMASFSSNGKQLVYSAYTAAGYRLAKMSFIPKKMHLYSGQLTPFHYSVDNIVSDTTFVLDNNIIPDSMYKIKKYSRIGHLINLYSWGPLSVNADNFNLQPGITLLSQNKLSTAVSSLSYLFNTNEQTGKVVYKFKYYGWYPEINFNISYAGRRNYEIDNKNIMQEVRWKETDISLGVNIPLNFTSSKWVRAIYPSATFHQRFLKMNPQNTFSFKNDKYSIVSFQLYSYLHIKSSPKDIFPKYGIWLDMRYMSTLFLDTNSIQKSLQGAIFLPGIVRHQGFRLYGALQQINGNYLFNNTVVLPRGYTGLNFNNFMVIKADYALPIAYPDWDVPALFYLKRIYTRIFYDNLYNFQNRRWSNVSSIGMELYTNWHFLSLFPEIELGIRYSREIEQRNNAFDILFNMAF